MSQTGSYDTEIEHLVRQSKVEQFLYREASLLEEHRLNDWLELLGEDIEYKVPVRTTRERGIPTFSEKSFHFNEDKGSLRSRVKRFDSEFAWAENPPSRLTYFVSNVMVDDEADGDLPVSNNVLIIRGNRDAEDYDLIAAKRADVVRETDDGFELAERTVYLNHTILGTHNLSFFL